MTPTILHIGMGKCGSSALQTAFTNHPHLDGAKSGGVTYAALSANGSLLSGARLTSAGRFHTHGYKSSCSVAPIIKLLPLIKGRLSNKLKELSGSGDRILLSYEGWCNERDVFEQSDLIRKLDMQCQVLAYVRPPVEWVNSAWWQWGAWTKAPLGRWLNRELPKARWYDQLAPWATINGVEKIHVRLLPKDIVSDFCTTFDLPLMETSRSNTSLSGTVLRLYQRHRDFRPGPHDSEMDFVLGRHLKGGGAPTPWILGPKVVQMIMDATRESNERLLELLDEDSRNMMRDDPRWWDADAYASRVKEPVIRERIRPEELEVLAVQAMQALRLADEENRKLRRQLEDAAESE